MTRRWRNPDKRMEAAVELRRRGYSLRRIGAEMGVGKSTIERDLARWEHQQVDALLSHSVPSTSQWDSPMGQPGGAQ